MALKNPGSYSLIRVEFIEMTKDELLFSLTRFVLEAKKQSGDYYPAETLYELIISLQMYLSCNGRELKFLSDPFFQVLKNTLDSRMKQLSAKGIRAPRKRADVITLEEEEKMWGSVLGEETPQQLLDTLVYMLGLHFALRAAQEHRDLRHGDDSQIKVV